MKETNNGVPIADEAVMNKIHYIRNHKVMLDKDLAELFGVNPRRLREQVKRNIQRFPKNFMFQLSENELDAMVSHFATPSRQYFGGSLPYAFTEHGVLMLANVLKSERAVAVSLRLIEIFVKMREILSANKDILIKLEQLEKKVTNHGEDIQMIFSALKQLLNPPTSRRQRIGFRRNNERNNDEG
jgi:phage regulator Rha-like protein